MPFDPNDPNQQSQGDVQQQAQGAQEAFAQLLRTIQSDPEIVQAMQSGGPDAATQIMRRKYPDALIARSSVNPDGTIKLPPVSDKAAWEALGIVAAIPLIAIAATTAIGAAIGSGAPAAGSSIAAPFVPAGSAIAPSVDIGAGALSGGLTAGIPTAGGLSVPGTLSGLTTPGVGAAATTPEWTVAGSGLGAAPAATASSVAPTAGGFSGFVKTLGGWPTVIGAGVNLAGSAIQAHAASSAAEQAAQAARDALNVQAQEYNTNTGLNVAQANQTSQAYNQTVANLAPYRGVGAAALSNLGYLAGLPGYQGGNTSVVNAPAPIVPVHPLSVPPPITPPGASQPGQSIPNQAYIPTTQITNGQPQQSTGNNWSSGASSGAPKVGDKRLINGQVGTWDGKGWAA